ncbi:hypothetical protein AWN90_36150 [Nocardia terpenica]|uniref:Uncharacterized protein n=2 Tax=Nocardia terpenica TaxID=455432 RepID=A0A164LFM5_9NOCA|nr:hypothetical protein AWN90_36150 [Nocardia terpenica]
MSADGDRDEGMRMTNDRMVRGLRSICAMVGVLVASAGAGACGSSGSPTPVAADSRPEVIDCSFDQPAVRPPTLILACADLGMRVEQIRWRSWGTDKAEGDGVEHDNTCDPNCAAGHFVTKQVHVVLSEPVQPGNVFTKATTIDADGKATTRPLTKR